MKKNILKIIINIGAILILTTASFSATMNSEITQKEILDNITEKEIPILGPSKTASGNEDLILITMGSLDKRNKERIPIAHMYESDVISLKKQYKSIILSKSLTSSQKFEESINLLKNYGIINSSFNENTFKNSNKLSKYNSIMRPAPLLPSDEHNFWGPTIILTGCGLGQFTFFPLGTAPPLNTTLGCEPIDNFINSIIDEIIEPFIGNDITIDLENYLYLYFSWGSLLISSAGSASLLFPTLYPDNYFAFFIGPMMQISLITLSMGFFFYSEQNGEYDFDDPILDVVLLIPLLYNSAVVCNYLDLY